MPIVLCHYSFWMKHSSPCVIILTNSLANLSGWLLHLSISWPNNPPMINFESSAAGAGQTYAHTTLQNSHFGPCHAYFSGTVACTRVISVTMFPLGTYIYHVMSSLMKTCSHLPTTSLHCQNISLKLPFFQRCILPHTLHLTSTLNILFYPLCMMTLILLYHASILL
jgi:hypothetical protein